MLTFKDIKEYDVQSIDFKKLFENLTHRWDYLINTAIIIVTFFLGIKIMANQNGKASRLQQEMTVVEQKVKAVSEFEVAKKSVENYLASLSQGLLETNTIIERLNNLATIRHIQILSYEPLGHRTTDVYVKANFKLILATDSYENIGLFIQDIENSNYNFRIEEWSAQTSGGDLKNENIRSDLVLSSLYFKK